MVYLITEGAQNNRKSAVSSSLDVFSHSLTVAGICCSESRVHTGTVLRFLSVARSDSFAPAKSQNLVKKIVEIW